MIRFELLNLEILAVSLLSDNPGVDIHGANVFKNQLGDAESNMQNKHVESILVSTGVYNPQNDLRLQTKILHEAPEKIDSNELLSRQNSFINYFESQHNVPDLIVDNLSDAVEHIIQFKENNKYL